MNWVKTEDRPKVLISLLIMAILIFSIFRYLDFPLRTQAAPMGIVSFELAGTQGRSEQILSSWKETSNLYAAFGLGFDFLFMIIYAFAISLACIMVSDKYSGWRSKLGMWLGWGIFLAAALDAVENIALWNLLVGNFSINWSILAAGCASVKFGIIIVGIVYAVAGWLFPKVRIGSRK